MAEALGLYISIPFCRSKCTYCNFASGVYPASEHERYVGRLLDEMHRAADWAREFDAEIPHVVDTIYLGGGTPSLLEPDLIERLFAAMRGQFAVAPDVEITVECAPGQLADEALAALVAAGVTRVSLGVQSFIDREAQVSGRLHTRAVALNDIERLRAAGIANVNVDLIAGLAGQTPASWEESLRVLVESGVPHASVYMLEVDDDSRLGREMLAGGARYFADLVPTDDTIARMYETALETLAAAGLAQYEISNFSLAGHESRHNLRYWQRRPYLGLGLDASSMLRAGSDVLRTTTTADLKVYLEGSEAPERTRVTRNQQHEEAWFLGLRMNAGVNVAALRDEFGAEFVSRAQTTVQRFASDGLLVIEVDKVRLTPQGRLLSNEVFAEFLESAETAPAVG